MKIDLYAVMGNPIAHSKSPQIHTAFAKQTGQVLEYSRILVEPEDFEQAVLRFKELGGKGLNITVPFKEAAWKLADKRSKRAELAGAVNTLWFDKQGQCCAENTDGVGLVRDLTNNHAYQIAEKRLLILGAGGAVRGVLEPLLKATPLNCVIANRTVSKAKALAEFFSEHGNLKASTYENLPGQRFDLIINGTSASLQGKLPPLPDGLLNQGGWCYDMMYAKTATTFMLWAKAQGAACVLDGLGMLVEQAAESFYIWRGVRPETGAVIRKVRQGI